MGAVNREKQIAEAEELLGDHLDRIGFAKGLFFGRYLGSRLPAYPRPAKADVLARVGELRRFCAEHIDPVAIDRQAEIPASVVAGLGRLGVLGACLPKPVGGLEWTQTDYCRLLEVLGGHCASTALFVNAHHSIGPRALVLFGTPEQQERWLPKLSSGEWISAFALTEPEAGSDAANVQTEARPSPDGRGYVLNGQKRWITNGGIAQVLTVMARTPVPGHTETKITAFIVTPDMPGFEVVEARMPKCGVRGTATSRLAFRDMFVPRENILGKLGKGLRVALTVLDFGRTTFGASCTGAAKTCLARAVEHANTRVQFGQPLASFELVKEKLAFMSAGIFAMEATTYATAALIDSGADDYMLETAMLKVWSTEVLWRIINDTFQIYGGKAYFTDEPYERMMRDARINMIGEGANDVLRAFTALVGMRDVGLELKGVLDALLHPLGNLSKLSGFASRRLGAMLAPPAIEVHSAELHEDAARLAKTLGKLGSDVEALLRRYRESILDRQYQLGRVADAATELYVSSCVLNRMDAMLHHHGYDAATRQDALVRGRYYLRTAQRRILRSLADLWDNDDEETNQLADRVIG
ncbi:MAG TPA: acyl-CoA dehydrogenase family protein [Pirellulales bacterium]|jgi:alkylation response protein AidB-like acyl-CoA dehydrogenase|nr:acyl-CoA dehydrogenase family protein [Pirellulales bacterium]